jgi:hypothetical protein
MSEMIERVAQALDPYAFSVDVQPAKEGHLTVGDIWAERQFTARRRARDAIEAMRAPTEDMIESMQAALDCVPINRCVEQALKVHAAMIDAALTETP